MPSEIENTVATPSQGDLSAVTPQVTTTNQPGSDAATTLSTTTSTENAPAPDETERLRVENERLRSGQSTLQRKLDRLMRQRNDSGSNQPQYSEDDIAEWAKNPMSQEMLIKAAEAELKEGVGELIKNYSSIPDPIKKAITANPRGWVKPGTVYVEDALNDIEDFLLSLSEGDGAVVPPQGATPAPKPKEFPVAATNAGNASAATANSGDAKVDAILELFQKGKAGLDEAFRRLSEREVDQKTFDKALELAEKAGLSIN